MTTCQWVIPNLHQMCKSNLVQAKKKQDCAMASLPSDQQHDIVELARKSRVQVKKTYNSAEDDRRKFRQERMIQEKKTQRCPSKMWS